MAQMVRRRWLPVVSNEVNLAIPFIHIEDAGAAVISALYHGRAGEVYNIADDQAASFADVTRFLASTIGAPQPRTISRWLVQLFRPFVGCRLAGDKNARFQCKGDTRASMEAAFPDLSRRDCRVLGCKR